MPGENGISIFSKPISFRRKKNIDSDLKKSHLVVDFGSKYLKFLVVKPVVLDSQSQSQEKLQIQKQAIIEIPEGSYENGKIIDAKPIKNAIEQVLKEKHITVKQVIICFETTEMIKRDIVVPKVSEEDLPDLVRYEISQYLPIDSNHYLMQHIIQNEVTTEEGNITYKLLVGVLPKEIAQSFFGLFQDLGLDPKILDVHSNGIEKLFTFNPKINGNTYPKEQSYAFIDLGYHSIEVSIIENQISQISRILHVGGHDLVEQIMDQRSFNNQEARQYIIQKITSYSSYEAFIQEIEKNPLIIGQLSTWVDEIEKVFRYYLTRGTGNRIDQIFIYGGEGFHPYLAEFLSNRLLIPAETMEELSQVSFQQSSSQIPFPMIINAIAAAIRQK